MFPNGKSLYLSVMTHLHHNHHSSNIPVSGKYDYLWHPLLIVAVVLISWWELRAIYHPDSLLLPTLWSSAITLAVIYLNVYILVPRLIFRQWYWVYLLAVIYVVIGVYFAESWINDMLPLKYSDSIRLLMGKVNVSPTLISGTSVISMFILIVSSSAIVLFLRWTRLGKQIDNLNVSKINTKVTHYKQQINHRLVCDILQTTASMTTTDPDTASAMVGKLGDILRYQLYDSARNQTLLEADVKYLRDFLHMKSACYDGFSYDIEQTGSINRGMIPPLTLYSIADCFTDSDRLNIYIAANETDLHVECTGSTPFDREKLDDIIRRLRLYYNDKCSITGSVDDRPAIYLTLPLQPPISTQTQ